MDPFGTSHEISCRVCAGFSSPSLGAVCAPPAESLFHNHWHGPVMPFIVDHHSARRPRRDSAERPRPKLRRSPRLEVLETRCLLSGSRPKTVFDQGLRLPSRVAHVATNKIGSDEFDRRSERRALAQGRNGTTSARDHFERGSTFRVEGSMSQRARATAAPGLGQSAYVLVFETKDPHHTLLTAQEVPDVPYFGVVGTIGTGDPTDLYRLTLGAAAEQLDFQLAWGPSVPQVQMQFQLFDGTGRVLGEWSPVHSSVPSLEAEFGGLPAGSTVYLGISTVNPSGPGSPCVTIGYQLWVGVQSATGGSTSATTATAAVTSLGTVPGIATPLASPASSAFQQATVATQAASPVPATDGGGMRYAVGPPAIRSARPSGGLLSEGEPAPPEVPDFSVALSKEWDERSSLTESKPGRRNEVEPTALSKRERESSSLVVIPGSGGFPLIGAIAMGHRGWRPVPDAGDFSTLRGKRDLDREPGVGVAADELLAHSDIAGSEGAVEAQSRTHRGHLWADFPLSVFFVLGLTTVFTLNAPLSRLSTAFDSLAWRSAPRSHRTARRQKPAAAPDS